MGLRNRQPEGLIPTPRTLKKSRLDGLTLIRSMKQKMWIAASFALFSLGQIWSTRPRHTGKNNLLYSLIHMLISSWNTFRDPGKILNLYILWFVQLTHSANPQLLSTRLTQCSPIGWCMPAFFIHNVLPNPNDSVQEGEKFQNTAWTSISVTISVSRHHPPHFLIG